jgi:hypothetical protein
MNYDKLSTNSLKEFHDAIDKCLKEDDSTSQGEMKPYGVREFTDWAQHLQKIESELTKRNETFTSLKISPIAAKKPIPIEAILYERIKQCLAHEDSLPANAEKPYRVREYQDWKSQGDSIEKELDNMKHVYSKISW